ncbi:alpha/beta hydrolase [Halobacillus faecis]|uniref:Carboxymethylenebutenolidase n=1 Tax=Halobacillus faecis TaxID=360184 RepID=A0A511WNJ6_9BACI|nr:alpha/beta hydrolase [Halobacillus faecis]GEN52720.1 carboxymethylenebutenolidase [Halobacillus faecis]
MKKWLKYLLFGLLALISVGILSFLIWTQQTYNPTEEMNRLVEDTHQKDGWVIHEPEDNATKGIILYPGAKVEPAAYSYLAQQLASNGYVIGIPEMTLNLPILNSNKAQELMDRYAEVEEWYVGGHSLGGVAAASFVKEHPDETDGLILFASYPTEGSSFAKTDTPILSIYAENDGLTTESKIEETKSLLSTDTTLYKIEGGNHAQFGMYGPQKGDQPAEIPAKTQQEIIIRTIHEWIENQS